MPLRDPLDAWRAAKLLVDRHGPDAAIHAAQRVDELGAAGDEEGRRVWRAVLAAVEELQRTERASGEARH